MPVESAADRAAFLSSDEFAEEGTYTAAAGGSADVVGIWNAPHIDSPFEGASASDSQPTFLVLTSYLPAGAAGGDAGDTLALGETDQHAAATWRVVDVQPDGTGFTLLTLGTL